MQQAVIIVQIAKNKEEEKWNAQESFNNLG
jgi:hypothetical protein